MGSVSWWDKIMGRGDDELLTAALFMLAKQGVWQTSEDEREIRQWCRILCSHCVRAEGWVGRRENAEGEWACCRAVHRGHSIPENGCSGHVPERLPGCFCNTTEKVLFFYIKGAGGLYPTEDFPDPVSCSGPKPSLGLSTVEGTEASGPRPGTGWFSANGSDERVCE